MAARAGGYSRERRVSRSAFGRGPLHDCRAPGHATAERGKHQGVALAYTALRDGIAQRDRDRGRRGVTEAVDVDEDLRTVQPQSLCDRFDDAGVRLVRHEEVDVFE